MIATPGHADGHLCLVRDGVLIAGDHVLPTISPAVGLYPDSRPDPLADYLRSLEETAALDLRVALPGHGEPVEDPGRPLRELIEHHRRRLDDPSRRSATGRGPATRSRSACFQTSPPPGPGASPWPRRSRIWNGSSVKAEPGATMTTGGSPILIPSLDDEPPPSTRAPESGA